MPRGLVVAIFASMLVHMGALAVSAMGGLGAPASDTAKVLDRPVSVRVVTVDRARDGWSGDQVDEGLDRHHPQVTETLLPPVQQPVQHEAAGMRASSAAVAGVRAQPEAALPSMAPNEPSRHGEVQVEGLSTPDVPMVDGYVLRKALSTPPVPRDEVKLAWPEGWFSGRRQAGVFTVFIDEDGRVQRMVIDGPTLAPALEAAALSAFKATRFEPGRIADKAVKSLIRIEVEFTEETPVAGSAIVVSRKQL